MYLTQQINEKIFWDDKIMEAFDLDTNVVSLEKLSDKLKQEKIIKGNYVNLNDKIKKLLFESSNYKYSSRIRKNIFFSYLLSNYSVNNNVPNCYYCSYKKDFQEIPTNDLNNILNILEV